MAAWARGPRASPFHPAAMGNAAGNVHFNAQDSLSGDGLPSIVSDQLEDVSPDEFWALFSMDLRNRHPRMYGVPCQAAPSWEQLDDERLVVLHPCGSYALWSLRCKADEAVCDNFGRDGRLEKPLWSGTIKVHRSPFRIEFWSLVYGQRDTGSRLKDIMKKLLQTMRSKAACAQDVDSPSHEGCKCVLSDPIVDSILSPEMFWKQTKELIKRKAFKILPDGAILQKTHDGGWDLWKTTQSYTKHAFNEARKEIVSCTYSDLGLSEESLEQTRHLRIHMQPFRLEMWMATPDQRRAADVEREQLLSILEPVFEHVTLMAECPLPATQHSEMDHLRREVDSFRGEISQALSTLRAGVVALNGQSATA